MKINIYQDFLSKQEIEFLTGMKSKVKIIEILNREGIKFTTNAHGYPIVRRDYAQIKHMKKTKTTQECSDWMPRVLQT